MRKQKQYHFIYKTTNLLNGKFYIGMHSTNNLNDGYLGSGLKLRRSIKKYGEKNFKIKILEFLLNKESLRKREKELVNKDIIKDSLCMNLVIGGGRGWPIWACKKGGQSFIKLLKDPIFFAIHSKRSSDTIKKTHAAGKLKYDNFKGKHHTPKTIEKIRIARLRKINEQN